MTLCDACVQDTLEMVRLTAGNIDMGVRDRLQQAMDSVGEMTQDFTDSAYTPHHHREQILDFLEECRFEVGNLMRPEMVGAEYACLSYTAANSNTPRVCDQRASK
jgi:hypothetical protein